MTSITKCSSKNPAATIIASLLFAAALALDAAPTRAEIQIVYQTENLPDVDPGKDLWRYTYTVSGQAFDLSYGFNVYYPWQSFGAIDLIAFPQDHWGPVDALDPEEALDLPGLLSAQAKQNLPAAPWQFVVDVVWLDRIAARPGSQRYELFDADFVQLDPPGTLGTVAIPEPQTGLLMLAGFTLLAALSMGRRVARGCAWRR